MLTTKREIKNWLDEYKILNYTINEDLSVDVKDDVRLDNRQLNYIPVKFNKIDGGFFCSYNQLTSTEFIPNYILKSFDISNNKFEKLNTFPKQINGSIFMDANRSLEDISKIWSCEYRGSFISCDEKIVDELKCYLISINRLKEVHFSIKNAHFYNNF